MPRVHVIGYLHAELAALGSKSSGMPALTFGMLQSVGYFRGVITDLR
jgi:hypothetical protein